MTNPATTHPTTNTAVDHTKPSKLEVIKDKAATLVDKVAGKSHHTTTATTINPAADQHLRRHQGNPVDYLNIKDPLHHNQDPTHHHSNQPHHDKNLFHQHKSHHDNPLHTGAAVGDAAVPHQPTVKDAAYKQHLDSQTAGVPASTNHVPTYTQNIAPPAAGVIPTAHVAEQVPVHHQEQDKHGHNPLHDHDSRQYGSVIPPTEQNTTQHAMPPTYIPAPTGSQGAPIATTGTTDPSRMTTVIPGQYQPTSGVPPEAIVSNFDVTHRPVA
ncbi:hypothetical protein BG006_004762 [Podila minutissima]|uniref:Uncharacterized protein n=1 Tax=Podila minutissima TaxID=64525 RepID=A0A9P5SNA9_9FUNG|nr:hypothetical protein BG006_004762 [Podila minutissima]